MKEIIIGKVKIKKSLIITGIAVLLLTAWVFVRFVIGGNEDSWIKDSRGVYIKHGSPAETPDYVSEQQEAIDCAMEKLNNLTGEKNSQCLGTCGDYAVDIVHLPRIEEDNLAENQCEDYRNGKLKHFIELDSEGRIVRIV